MNSNTQGQAVICDGLVKNRPLVAKTGQARAPTRINPAVIGQCWPAVSND